MPREWNISTAAQELEDDELNSLIDGLSEQIKEAAKPAPLLLIETKANGSETKVEGHTSGETGSGSETIN
jgi:hypothetical protein